ncbi:hypothetical protein K501DRAFT_331834 [Backusella circina FSU 941]|nr:hypothetical protein K501DRAFT_331834 [Backusella circina FSU 941]
MHPALVAIIALGGVFVLWGGYEAVSTIYEWHNDRKEEREYEEYVKAHKEKYSYIYLQEDDDEEDNEPLELLNDTDLRHRRQFKQEQDDVSLPQYEISEMERSLSARRSVLQKEQELLYEAEAELDKKKLQVESKGNSIMGVFHDSDPDHSQYELLSTPLNIKEHGSDNESWCNVNRERSNSGSTEDSYQRL